MLYHGAEHTAMVIASHIKPYYVCDKSERANPANGLLLNAFYDRAFDQGLMTVLPDLTIQVSNYVKDGYDDQNTRDWLLGVEGTKSSGRRGSHQIATCWPTTMSLYS